jgi:DNA-binding MarR family transcriptional regulator
MQACKMRTRNAAYMKKNQVGGSSRNIIETGDPGSPDFDPNHYLFRALSEVDHWYAEQIARAMKASGTDRSRWRVLMALKWRGAANLKDLSAMTNIKQSTLSRLIERMRDDGFVVTALNEGDSRFIDVSLAPPGTMELQSLTLAASRVYQKALGGLQAEDIAQMLATLEKITLAIQMR